MTTNFTIPGLDLMYSFDVNPHDLSPQEKKQLRIRIFKQIPTKFLPLHAALIDDGKRVFAITGDSGYGKTTLVNKLKDHKFKTIANDFILLWEKKGNLYAGDINYENNNVGKVPRKIDKIVFLDLKDKRDYFLYNRNELNINYLQNLGFKYSAELEKRNGLLDAVYKKHVVLGNRQNPERWQTTFIENLINKNKISKIGIVGLGTVGMELGYLLGFDESYEELNLYTRNFRKMESYVLDIKSSGIDKKINLKDSFEELYKSSDVIFLTFKATPPEKSKVGIRKAEKNYFHADILWKYSRAIRKIKEHKMIFAMTNPVDLISWMTYYLSNLNDNFELDWNGLKSNQVLGVGLGLDYTRMRTRYNKKYEVLGSHSETLFLAKVNEEVLSFIEDPEILHYITTYPKKIMERLGRTKYGPAKHCLDLSKEILKKEGTIRASTITSMGGFIGDVQLFRDKAFGSTYSYGEKVSEKNRELIERHSYRNEKILKYLKKHIE